MTRSNLIFSSSFFPFNYFWKHCFSPIYCIISNIRIQSEVRSCFTNCAMILSLIWTPKLGEVKTYSLNPLFTYLALSLDNLSKTKKLFHIFMRYLKYLFKAAIFSVGEGTCSWLPLTGLFYEVDCLYKTYQIMHSINI